MASSSAPRNDVGEYFKKLSEFQEDLARINHRLDSFKVGVSGDKPLSASNKQPLSAAAENGCSRLAAALSPKKSAPSCGRPGVKFGPTPKLPSKRKPEGARDTAVLLPPPRRQSPPRAPEPQTAGSSGQRPPVQQVWDESYSEIRRQNTNLKAQLLNYKQQLSTLQDECKLLRSQLKKSEDVTHNVELLKKQLASMRGLLKEQSENCAAELSAVLAHGSNKDSISKMLRDYKTQLSDAKSRLSFADELVKHFQSENAKLRAEMRAAQNDDSNVALSDLAKRPRLPSATADDVQQREHPRPTLGDLSNRSCVNKAKLPAKENAAGKSCQRCDILSRQHQRQLNYLETKLVESRRATADYNERLTRSLAETASLKDELKNQNAKGDAQMTKLKEALAVYQERAKRLERTGSAQNEGFRSDLALMKKKLNELEKFVYQIQTSLHSTANAELTKAIIAALSNSKQLASELNVLEAYLRD